MPQMLFMDMNLYLTHSYYANVLFNSEFRERNSERKFWDTIVQKIHLNLAVANGKKINKSHLLSSQLCSKCQIVEIEAS